MKHLWLVALGLAAHSPAWGQSASLQVTQQAPLQQQWQQQGAGIPPSRMFPGPSGLTTSRPAVPDGTALAPQAPPSAAPATPAQATGMRPEAWVPAQAVRLQALDKVNAQTVALTIKVGQSAKFGSLTIDAKSCMVRPPDRPADAAAYLAVTDAHGDAPRFDGWMLAAEPALSMMQHPVYDLRVSGCV